MFLSSVPMSTYVSFYVLMQLTNIFILCIIKQKIKEMLSVKNHAKHYAPFAPGFTGTANDAQNVHSFSWSFCACAQRKEWTF